MNNKKMIITSVIGAGSILVLGLTKVGKLANYLNKGLDNVKEKTEKSVMEAHTFADMGYGSDVTFIKFQHATQTLADTIAQHIYTNKDGYAVLNMGSSAKNIKKTIQYLNSGFSDEYHLSVKIIHPQFTCDVDEMVADADDKEAGVHMNDKTNTTKMVIRLVDKDDKTVEQDALAGIELPKCVRFMEFTEQNTYNGNSHYSFK